MGKWGEFHAGSFCCGRIRGSSALDFSLPIQPRREVAKAGDGANVSGGEKPSVKKKRKGLAAAKVKVEESHGWHRSFDQARPNARRVVKWSLEPGTIMRGAVQGMEECAAAMDHVSQSRTMPPYGGGAA